MIDLTDEIKQARELLGVLEAISEAAKGLPSQEELEELTEKAQDLHKAMEE